MTDASGDNEQVKQLVKAEKSAEIRFFEDINDTADRVGQAARGEQLDSGGGHGEHYAEVKRNRPAERKIERRADEPGRVDPEQLDRDAGQGNQPDNAEKDKAARRRHEFENDRRVAARNQHVNHAVVELFQAAHDRLAAPGELVSAARGIERDKRQTEHDRRPGKLTGNIRLHQKPHEQRKQTDSAEHRADKMGIAGKWLSGLEKCTRHMDSSLKLCRV